MRIVYIVSTILFVVSLILVFTFGQWDAAIFFGIVILLVGYGGLWVVMNYIKERNRKEEINKYSLANCWNKMNNALAQMPSHR